MSNDLWKDISVHLPDFRVGDSEKGGYGGEY